MSGEFVIGDPMPDQAFILVPVPADRNALLDRMVQVLAVRFDGLGRAERTPDGLALWVDGWVVRGQFVEEPHVLAEAQEIVDRFGADRPDAPVVRTYSARLEISCDADPTMDHFNDYLFVCEALSGLDGAVAFDLAEPAFWR